MPLRKVTFTRRKFEYVLKIIVAYRVMFYKYPWYIERLLHMKYCCISKISNEVKRIDKWRINYQFSQPI